MDAQARRARLLELAVASGGCFTWEDAIWIALQYESFAELGLTYTFPEDVSPAVDPSAESAQ